MPPLDEFVSGLKRIWDNRILTNNGPLHQELEKELARYLGVEYLSLFSNGTLALMVALKALGLKGEVITTPFSFVATTNSIRWNGLRPVFADIEPDTFNLDPDRVEAAITPATTAIMPVHVYGNPCAVERLEKIAKAHGLRLVYDAAHAFGVRIGADSLLNHGDMSVLSFHATKVYSTIEGGAIVCRDKAAKEHVDRLKNFGIVDDVTVCEPGINAKLNEVQAAFGLLQLKYVDSCIERRRGIAEAYREKLRGVSGIAVPGDIPGVRHNYSYFPVLIDAAAFGATRDEVFTRLKEHGILARRYFYPLISDFPAYRDIPSAAAGNLPIATRVASQVLCLPIYPDLSLEDQDRVCRTLLDTSHS